ncbi:MAG: TfoX/Sxy family protein [Polyangiales bacterium]
MAAAPKPKSAALPRAPESLITYLREQVQQVVGRLEGVGLRKLLVSTGWAVNERVFTFVNRQGRIVVRLPDEAAQQALLALDGAEPWRYSQRAPPRGWLLLPESMHDDPDDLRAWLTRAYQLARDTTPKPARKTPRSISRAPRRKKPATSTPARRPSKPQRSR